MVRLGLDGGQLMSHERWTAISLPPLAGGRHVVGAGDFNGDGKADLVWENITTGRRTIWMLQNGVFRSSLALPTIDPSWHIAGVGDFLGNGQADLVWENTATGSRAIWILKNGVLQSGISRAVVFYAMAYCRCGRLYGNRQSRFDLGKYAQRSTPHLGAQ